MIRITDLNKTFYSGKRNGLHVIKDITLDIPERGMVAIFGRSGCGKTTLLNLIGGLETADSGEVLIDGRRMSPSADALRNEYVGYVFQNYNLRRDVNCAEAVADALRLMGIRDKKLIDERVASALRCVGMEKYAKRMPSTLSGGQQQRIAIARAIVKRPKIILADEPTGNLDEANTAMIMELLHEISRECLVLLVTHEEELIGKFADSVISLSDGRAISFDENDEKSSKEGLPIVNRDVIYLGDMEKRLIDNGDVLIERYGEDIKKPILLRIVNTSEGIFLEIENDGVKVLDGTSGLQLSSLPAPRAKDMTLTEEKVPSESGEHIDELRRVLSEPPRGVKRGRYGALFGFAQSIKSGYKKNFTKTKKSRKSLIACMLLFSMVLVFAAAVLGTNFVSATEADGARSRYTFYVFSGDGVTSSKILDSIGDAECAIDFARLHYGMVLGDEEITLNQTVFETFSPGMIYFDAFGSNAVFLDTTLIEDKAPIVGKISELSDDEVVISSALADSLLEESNLGYVESYKDLLGMSVFYPSVRVVGVVESSEEAVYFSPVGLANYVNEYRDGVYRADEFYTELKSGEVTVAKGIYSESAPPAIGSQITLQGIPLTVKEIISYYNSYAEYIEALSIEKLPLEEYVTEKYSKAEPSAEEMAALCDAHYFDYLDYYYSELDAFIRSNARMTLGELSVWYYIERGLSDAKYSFTEGGEEYYSATLYKRARGEYPKRSELAGGSQSLSSYLFDAYTKYADEYNSSYRTDLRHSSTSYLISDEDYITLSKTYGKSSDGVGISDNANLYYYNDDRGNLNTIPLVYTVIHSSNPNITEKWIEKSFGGMKTGAPDIDFVVTPRGIYENAISESREVMLVTGIGLLVMLIVMSLCMYFIMRSSLIGSVREVGIYRAIGVSRRNIIFKYFTEALTLSTLTVLVGYLFASGFIWICSSRSSLVAKTVFFYPPAYALALFVILMGVTLLLGVLPVFMLLRKSPGEILAKYDI